MRKFREAHKQLAIAYVLEGRSVAEVSAELSISKSSLHAWVAERKKEQEHQAALQEARREAQEMAQESALEHQPPPSFENHPLWAAAEALLKEIRRQRIRAQLNDDIRPDGTL